MTYTFAFLFISKLNGTVFMGRFFAVRRDHHPTTIIAYYVYKEILTKNYYIEIHFKSSTKFAQNCKFSRYISQISLWRSSLRLRFGTIDSIQMVIVVSV